MARPKKTFTPKKSETKTDVVMVDETINAPEIELEIETQIKENYMQENVDSLNLSQTKENYVPYTEISTFYDIAELFYRELEKLRIEKSMYPESKALVANAGAYMTKALKTIDVIKEIKSNK